MNYYFENGNLWTVVVSVPRRTMILYCFTRSDVIWKCLVREIFWTILWTSADLRKTLAKEFLKFLDPNTSFKAGTIFSGTWAHFYTKFRHNSGKVARMSWPTRPSCFS